MFRKTICQPKNVSQLSLDAGRACAFAERSAVEWTMHNSIDVDEVGDADAAMRVDALHDLKEQLILRRGDRNIKSGHAHARGSRNQASGERTVLTDRARTGHPWS